MTDEARRDFVKAAGATALASTGPFASRVLGANERPVGALIGCGGMGRANLRDFLKTRTVDIAAVCDVYEPNMDLALEMTDGRARAYKDFRQVLDRKDVDFVIIAPPDHWHALPTVMACDASKDVYVEKPLSLTIAEGRKMVEAARRNKRVVQVGTQQRSGRHFQTAVELVQNGTLGIVSFARCWNYMNQYPAGLGTPPDTPPLHGLDWDFWLGPAPLVPYNRNRFLGTFRWYWDYSGGMLTDWGTHLVDVVQWAMKVDSPQTAYATGGKLHIQDSRETPDTLEVLYEYPGFVLNYSYRILNGRGIDGKGYGISFHGTRGTLFLDRDGWEFFPERATDETQPPAEKAQRSDTSAQHYPHVVNFIECLKSRDLPNSDIEIGHRSTSACHIGNISYKLKRKVTWNGTTERFVSDAEADAMLSRPYRKPWSL